MLLAVVGALLGWRGVVVALSGGSMIGTVIVLTALLIRRAGGEPLPMDAPDAPDRDRQRDPGGRGAHPRRTRETLSPVHRGAVRRVPRDGSGAVSVRRA
jgi:hypothetical protein